MNENLVNLAREKASQQGLTLDQWIENSLRATLQATSFESPHAERPSDLLEADDKFFFALDEIRNLGRRLPHGRPVDLSE